MESRVSGLRKDRSEVTHNSNYSWDNGQDDVESQKTSLSEVLNVFEKLFLLDGCTVEQILHFGLNLLFCHLRHKQISNMTYLNLAELTK